MRSLNHRQLEAFRAVFITGSMTGAGRVLCISQPAITRLIQDLEGELQLELFHRQGNRIKPTPHGVKIYQEVARYLDGGRRIRDIADGLRRGNGGHLRLAVMPMLSMYVLPEAITRFLQIAPDIQFTIHSDVSSLILDGLRRNEFDVGFARITSEGSDLAHDPMPNGDVVCVLPNGHRLAAKACIELSDMDGEPFIALGSSSHLRLQIDTAMEAAGLRFGRRIETLFSHTVDQYVAKGLGIAVADPISLLHADPSKTKIRPLSPALQFDFSAVYPPNPMNAELVKQFVPVVEAVLYEQLGARFQ